MSDDPDVDAAYALQGDDDIRRLYGDWAETYDAGFGAAEGYQLPQEVARAFVGAGGAGPVLDVGAGTGLVGEALAAHGVGPLDGLDLSAEMLAIADRKGAYRHLIAASVQDPPDGLGGYSGVVSAGTFTLGHVGPEGLEALLPLAIPGALFVISVNAAHFESAGFAAELDRLAPRISDVTLRDVRIYDGRAAAHHRDDLALLVIFRTA